MADLMRRISLLQTLKNPSEEEKEELEFYRAVMRAFIYIFRNKNYCTLVPLKINNCSVQSARKYAKTLRLQVVRTKGGEYLKFTKEEI